MHAMQVQVRNNECIAIRCVIRTCIELGESRKIPCVLRSGCDGGDDLVMNGNEVQKSQIYFTSRRLVLECIEPRTQTSISNTLRVSAGEKHGNVTNRD
jgi:hypothetical protein